MLGEEKWSKGQFRPAACQRDLQQRVQVRLPFPSGLEDQAVDHLLAGELNSATEPPYGRMKPQDGHSHFFEQAKEPIVTAYMPQLVAADRFLKGEWHFPKAVRNQNKRLPETESDGAANLAGEIDWWIDTHQLVHLNHCLRKWVQPMSFFHIKP